MNDTKCSRYRRNVVIELNSGTRKNNVFIRKPPEFFNWGSF